MVFCEFQARQITKSSNKVQGLQFTRVKLKATETHCTSGLLEKAAWTSLRFPLAEHTWQLCLKMAT